MGVGIAPPLFRTVPERDHIHVDDLASAHVLALGGLVDRPFMRYNLSNRDGYSVLEVIETARRVTGHSNPAVIRPRRPGDPAILIASHAAIQRDLGWQPKHPDFHEASKAPGSGTRPTRTVTERPMAPDAWVTQTFRQRYGAAPTFVVCAGIFSMSG
jgi:nucleoside-diphosphate-sugar epimerase